MTSYCDFVKGNKEFARSRLSDLHVYEVNNIDWIKVMTFCSSEVHVVSRSAHEWYEMNLWWLSEVMLSYAWSSVFSPHLWCSFLFSLLKLSLSYNSALTAVRCDYPATREPETLFKVVIVFLPVYRWWHHLFLCLPVDLRGFHAAVVCLSLLPCLCISERRSEMICCPSVHNIWLWWTDLRAALALLL